MLCSGAAHARAPEAPGSAQTNPEPGGCPGGPGAVLRCFCARRSVSTIRNQRYHIHANLAGAVLLAQALLLASFQLSPATVSAGGPGAAPGRDGPGHSRGGFCRGGSVSNTPWPKTPSCCRGSSSGRVPGLNHSTGVQTSPVRARQIGQVNCITYQYTQFLSTVNFKNAI